MCTKSVMFLHISTHNLSCYLKSLNKCVFPVPFLMHKIYKVFNLHDFLKNDENLSSRQDKKHYTLFKVCNSDHREKWNGCSILPLALLFILLICFWTKGCLLVFQCVAVRLSQSHIFKREELNFQIELPNILRKNEGSLWMIEIIDSSFHFSFKWCTFICKTFLLSSRREYR